jgi:hypothetical protein
MWETSTTLLYIYSNSFIKYQTVLDQSYKLLDLPMTWDVITMFNQMENLNLRLKNDLL